MEIQEFIRNVAEQFDETDPSVFTPETSFRELDEMSSLITLSLVAMIEEEYNVVLTGPEIRSITTVNDLFELVQSKAE